ncbi:hypothetical protein EJ04DRAFT_501369 [Polyplosphaeria fusca]|uniref:Uncharacterized protein n=1 Tax=Polyplosphaeria fusca TaxID=682080 RepID=A0A9P4QS54_9PLEO|nr:hypothetical protein EJ04DRAFT_501369 [Polyplosphaeria fusca]
MARMTADPEDSAVQVVEPWKAAALETKSSVSFSPTASPALSPAIQAQPPSSGNLSDAPPLPTDGVQTGWKKRNIPRWKSPLLMILFFIIGLAMSLAHCIYYPKLHGVIVGDSSSQEEKLRFGTAFSFLAQISLAASVWTCFTQWLWRTVDGTEMSVGALNDAFGIDTSVLPFLNYEMLRKLRVGSVMALFAWSLLLPPFFTPATLFVSPSINIHVVHQNMSYPNIASGSEGHRYAYSPPIESNRVKYRNDKSRMFTGPRTILNLIATATASLGEILPIKSSYNTSEYSIGFFAPIVKCAEANSSETDLISGFLRDEMSKPLGTKNETDNVYFSFVPTLNSTDGTIIPNWKPRQQSPSKALNQLWMTFIRLKVDSRGNRIKERHYQVCRLMNSTYNLTFSHDHGFQNISGSYTVNEEVPFPTDAPGRISNMAQHAYSAFLWTLTDQLVGKFSWYVKSNASDSADAPQFGVIESAIQRTSILGSWDLDAFFDLDEEKGLYANNDSAPLGDQRLQDKALAKNRTLDVLIEELSFNTTVSLMHNELLTQNRQATVLVTTGVNRYSYKALGLFIPYGLANLFAFICVLLGVWSYTQDGVYPDKKFQDIVSSAEDPEIIQVVRDRRRSVTMVRRGDSVTWKAGSKGQIT